VVNKTAARAR